MKRWAALTVFLYVLALAALVVPVLIAAFPGLGPDENGKIHALEFVADWGTWTWIGVAALCQVLLLVVPVGVAEGRPVTRRKLVVPLVTASALLAFMTIALVATLFSGLGGDDGLKAFMLDGPDDGAARLLVLVGYPLLAWSAWGFLFHRRFRHADPQSLTQRLTTWLLRGSILELLVAVPCHVMARNRNDCCAPYATFWGIVTGLTLMLMSFGPGVFFLFAERMRRLRPPERP